MSASAALTQAGRRGDGREGSQNWWVMVSAMLRAGLAALFCRDWVQGKRTQLLETRRNLCHWENKDGPECAPWHTCLKLPLPTLKVLLPWGWPHGFLASEAKGVPGSWAGLSSEVRVKSLKQPPVKDGPGGTSLSQDARKQFHPCLASLRRY